MCNDPEQNAVDGRVRENRPPGSWAWLPVPVFLLAAAVLWWADSRTVYESPYLLMGLNLVFVTGVSLFVAYLMGRSFLARGQPGLLLLGCGVLFWGASGSMAIVANLAQGGGSQGLEVNLASTIHNTCVWVSSLCHLAGVAFSLRWGLSLPAMRRWLAGGYAAALGLVGLITLATLSGWMPHFFVQGQGGTPLRQFVLGSAIAMFLFTAFLLRTLGRPRSSAFTEWYALGLLLLSVGYWAVLVQPVQGGLLGWTGRAAQFFGGAYLLAAALAARREPGGQGMGLAQARQDTMPHRYAVAVALAVAAAIVRLVFLQALGTQVAFVTFYPAVMIAALYGGLRSGLVAAVLSALLADYFWIEPIGQFAVGHPSGWLGIVVFLLSCTMIAAITESMHRAHARANKMAAQAAFADDPQQGERVLRAREERLAREQLKAVFPVNVVFPIALMMLAALFWLSYRNATDLLESEQGENRAYSVVHELDRLLSAVTAAETGERGFLITGDEQYLQPYQQAGGMVAGQLAALHELTQDNPRQQQRLREIEAPIADKLAELEQAVTVRREQGFEAVQRRVAANIGFDRLGDIRRRVGELQDEELRLRQQRMAAKVASTHSAIQSGILGVVLGFTMLGLVYGLLRREIAERSRAEAEVFAQRNHLEEMVEARTAELAREFAEHKRAVQARRESEERLSSIVGSAMDAIISVDAEQRIVLFNVAAERMFGCAAGDKLGQPVEQLIPARFRAAHRDHLRRVIHGGATPRHLGQVGALTALRVNGEEFPIDASISQSSVGGQTLSTIILRDVTERRRAEEALRDNEERMRLVLKASSTGTFEIDFLSGETQWNDVEFELLGLKPGEILPDPQSFFRFVHPADIGRVETSWQAARHTGHLDVEFRIVRADGEERWLAGRGRFAFIDGVLDEQRRRFLGVNFDITDHKRVEERLRRSEASLAQAQAIANIGSWEWDVPSGELRWSDQLFRIFGEEPQAFAPSFGGFMARVHPDDMPRLDAVFNEAVARGVPFCLEHRVVTCQGEARVVLAQVEIELDGDGCVARIVGTALDITERKQAEAARARLAAIVEFSQDAIIGKNLDGVVSSWNRGAERLFGYAAEEMIGRPFACVVPEDRMDEEMGILARIRRGDVVEHFETERRHKDGTVIPIAITVSPVRDADGKVVGVSKIARDISERKRVEEERNAYIALIKTSTDFIGMCDNQGVPFFVNEAGLRLVGLDSLEQVLRKNVKDFFFAEDQAFITDEFFPRVSQDGQAEVEIRFCHFKTGEPIWMNYNVFILQDSAGGNIGFATVSRNITSRKQAQDALAQQAVQLQAQASQLREADRHKDEFLAMLAHELRNPLTPIMIAAQMLEKRGNEDPALVRWASDMVKYQCGHLTQLVNQLLDVSRVSRGKITLDKALLDLGELTRRAVETAKPLIEEHRHTLSLALPSEPLLVEGDAVRLEQVLGNLLTNAAKYTLKGGRIEVSLSREADTAVLRVRDNGVGMSAAMLPKVFDLFTQAERTLDRAQGGLGIGLALVKSLVELHGGRVEAASEGAGLGSEFVVRLPLPAQTLGAGRDFAAAAAAAESPSAAPARRILAVDDNEFVLASLAVLLQTLGHEVHTARNGREALDLAGKLPLDVALIDIGLPGLNGYEVARRLRQSFAPAELTLIAMTGYNQKDDRQKSKDAGFDLHLAKPFDPEALEKILVDLGELRRAAQALDSPSSEC